MMMLWLLKRRVAAVQAVVAITQGGTAEAAISDVIEMLDSMINQNLFLVARWSPLGEMVKEYDEDFERRIIQNSFLDYAARYWGVHALTVQQTIEDFRIISLRDTVNGYR
ncbi:hypothetical protein O988_04577 [Pseudogymnoascus sp. VKM F-3808]|nr:hypothetical protein O988_04577 [Pseudogymnoascus sp. VKM F-3808]